MKKLLFVIIASVLAYGYVQEHGVPIPVASLSPSSSDNLLQAAYGNKQSDLQVEGKGVVVKILNDDSEGSRHQRFILKLGSGQTLLISHNIDLAPRIGGLRAGDVVEFYGEYEWNSKGGVIHWTHRDPNNQHGGRTYQ
jgi:hypothetical protein